MAAAVGDTVSFQGMSGKVVDVVSQGPPVSYVVLFYTPNIRVLTDAQMTVTAAPAPATTPTQPAS